MIILSLNQNKFPSTSDLRPGLFVCRYVSIRSLSFSPDGQFLCASSNTETVHIFKLEQLGPSGVDEAATWTAYVGKMFSAASSYLPAQVSGMMSQDRAFATVHLPSSDPGNVCTLAV
ncbi:WD repeat domain phosphoinositide-interacting protein 1-like [Cynoglossus semilaevis]|uniref:WD repeat domain phosphoinositide-interacting protein 1-like n=1 Tax=Cynoglossus semilaevis TaxID=244447 RepID=UPI0007DCB553|nr:WD repeat domain phosphoinositide-interacting protein 1-like [Cynoglossus semilaevis]